MIPKGWWAVWDLDAREARSFHRDGEIARIQAIVDQARTGHRCLGVWWNYGTRRLDGR